MTEQQQKNSTQIPKTVAELLEQIRSHIEKGGADYIYRGEPKKYPDVSSNLYRAYGIKGETILMNEIQNTMMKQVRDLTGEQDPNTVLGNLQHYGGKTNQIDFSTDYLIALFFACDGEFREDGRLIFLDKKLVSENTRKPTQPQNRVIAQKSVFVCPPLGFIEAELYSEMVIPKKLKRVLFGYLRKYHDIHLRTIYNDIHGYISRHKMHEDANSHFYRGLIYNSKGETSKAKENCDKAIELNPEFVEAYFLRGTIHQTQDDYEAALADYNEVIELNPGSSNTYFCRGALHQAFNEHESAIADYSEAININPNYVEAYLYQAVLYLLEDEFEAALANLNRVIELNPNITDAYLNRGHIYIRRGDSESALADYNKAMELDPNSMHIYFARGKLRLALKKFVDARADLETALQLATDQGNNRYATKIQILLADIPSE